MKAEQKTAKMTATGYILKALIPYSEQNLKLIFHPSTFFDELERAGTYSRQTLRQTYTRAKKNGLLTDDSIPQLTAKGRQYVQPFVAKKIEGGQLMVIFDVPNELTTKRRQLRSLLRRLGFTHIQHSVWTSSDDHVAVVRDLIDELQLGDWVELYEVSKLR